MTKRDREIETLRALVHELGRTLSDIRRLVKAHPGEPTVNAVRKVCRARAMMKRDQVPHL